MDLLAAEARVSNDSERPPSSQRASSHASGHQHDPNQENDEQGFQKAIAAWRKVDLGKLVPELDTTVSDVLSNQRDSLVQRKELAQKTKDFRKLDDAGKLSEYKALLKAYQTFIDLLTSHGKTTSSAFLQLYTTLSEAPDPYPLLEASVDSLLVSEETLPKLTAENEHLQSSVSKLTDDLESTEQELEHERAARVKLETTLDTKSKGIEASWQAVLTEKNDNWNAKERSWEEKLENQDRLLSELKASYEVTQRLGHTSDGAEGSQPSASAAELEIVSSDLERTSQRLAEVEARNEQLRIELAQASSSKQQETVQSEDSHTSRLRSENAKLLRKLEASRFDKDSEARKWDSRLRTLERDAQSLQQDREELRTRLQQWNDYPEIKRELEVFKAIEFSTGDEDDAGSVDPSIDGDAALRHGGQSNGAAMGPKKDTLEQLLLARNKKLSDEMTVLRVSHRRLQESLESLRENLSTAKADLENSQHLNATLENDLLKLQQEASNNVSFSARSTTSRYPSASHFSSRARRSSPTSSIISGFDNQSSSYDTMEAIRAGEPVGGGSGILPMVQAQRDRFKQKNSQLEEDLTKQYNVVSSLRQEIASLQKDNLGLYEKTRYVSTYSRGQPASSGSAYADRPPSTAIQMDADTPSGLSLDRYRSTYEANISPFAAFRGREATRAYRKMRAPERIVFSVTRLVLTNRTSRNIFAAYCVALHVLIFLMLYWMQTADIAKHASMLGDVGHGLGGGTRDHWHEEGLAEGRS